MQLKLLVDHIKDQLIQYDLEFYYLMKEKCLSNDLAETKNKDPYSNRTDVIENKLPKTFPCMPTQYKISNSSLIIHL